MGSRADLAPFRYPDEEFLNKLVHQVDFPRRDETPKTRDPETNLHKYACRMMCDLTICQLVAGKAFTKEHILDIYKRAVNGELGPNVLDFQCTVGGGEQNLINEALRMLGDTKHTVRQHAVKNLDTGETWNMGSFNSKTLPGPGNTYFIIVDMRTNSSGDYGGHHFVLFNSVGELIYDPARNEIRSYNHCGRLIYYKVTGM